MMSKCIRRGRRLYSPSELKLGLSQEKMEPKIASSTSKIRLVVFIKTLFYLSQIIHNPAMKKDKRLAPLPKNGRIPYCQRFWKYTGGRCVQYNLLHKYFNIKIRISSDVTSINHHTRPKWKGYRNVASLNANCFMAPFWHQNFRSDFWVFGTFAYSCLDDRQFWHREIICIYTTTFLQIAHDLDFNFRFVLDFGELHKVRYRTWFSRI